MKKGQTVNYVDAEGIRYDAKIQAIDGVGSSKYKTLSVKYKVGKDVYQDEKVPHQGDAAEGSAFWYSKGEKRLREPQDEPLLAEAVVDPAFPDPAVDSLPAGRRRR